MQAIQVRRFGGPEVLERVELPEPKPGPGEVLVNVHAAGVNYIDIYHRTGFYPLELPFIPGQEGAGTVAAVGEGVSDLERGERVAWSYAAGSYAERRVVPAEKVVPVPREIDLDVAAAVMLQGITAHYLTTATFPLAAGHRVLIHAAAGGVGLLFIQMAKRRGALVAGTVGTEEKAELARTAGADRVIVYRDGGFRESILEWTEGKGVDAVFDSVGRATWEESLGCLARRGTLVLFGQSSGPVPPVELRRLSAGSFFLTRPSITHYIATREELLARAGEVLGSVAGGHLQVRIDSRFPLAAAGDAQRRIESRESTGKILIVTAKR